jgi:solute carrier family 25 phosphate transporter 23/24/25/41
MGVYNITVSLLALSETPCANHRSTEFRRFVQETEKELFALFESIDRNHDNKLTKDELQAAFSTSLPATDISTFARWRNLLSFWKMASLTVCLGRAGLSVPNSKLYATPNYGNRSEYMLIESREIFFEEMDVNGDGSISFQEWR